MKPCSMALGSDFEYSFDTVYLVLLVICPSSRVTYILDSLMKPKKNPLDTCYLLKLLDMAFARYEKTHQLQLYGCSLSWRIRESAEWALCNEINV
ncbi:unnamed protein product [Lactuca virosa]|uniref:Uncharacterized protein n=1 Tax=Lactuca virosa TaxID=75947 RepID=A0AAU9LM19_9ASTR|nr:unnamed protein product [Lactuca virosa]